MTAGVQRDCSPRLVSLVMGIAIGIPLCIILGILTHETGWGLVLGPVVGLAIGAVLAFMSGKGDAAKP